MWVLLIVASVGFKVPDNLYSFGSGGSQLPYYEMEMPSSYFLISQIDTDTLRDLYFNNASVKENENKETPLWIYGVEFLGGTIGEAAAWGTTALWISKYMNGENSWEIIYAYGLTSTLLSGSFTWLTGKLLGQEGSFINSLIGAGLGSALVSYLAISGFSSMHSMDPWDIPFELVLAFFASTFFPQLGAVIGYNLK